MAGSGSQDRPPLPPDGPAAFGGATPFVARTGLALFVALLLGLPAYLAGIAWELNAGTSGAGSVHIDFAAFWAAAKLAVAGEAASAFDPEALIAAQQLPPDARWAPYTWQYPALFHLMVAPLGLLGFSAAFAVFSVAVTGLYIWALRGWAAPVPGGLSLAVAAPPVAFVLATGNASLLWAALLLAALSFLARGRPHGAAAMIALMTMKPQLGLLIPVALLAGREWRVILWSTAYTAAVTALTVAVFGLDYWVTFFRTMSGITGIFASPDLDAPTMITWYAFARQFGAGHPVAIAVQVPPMALAAGAVWVLWSRRRVAMDLKTAALCLGILIATPYAFQYELVLAVLAALFLARAGIGRSPRGRLWLAALWLLPVPGWLIGELQIAFYAAPALTLSLALCLKLGLAPVRAPAAQEQP